MEVKATAKFTKMTPRKIRLVLDVVRGLDVSEALTQLAFINKEAAGPIKKLLESALANAINNFKLDKSNLYLAKVMANEGPTLKRWMPKAFGRATTIRKRSSHITLVLAEKKPTSKAVSAKEDKSKSVDRKLEVVSEKPKDTMKKDATDESGDDKKTDGKKGGKGFTKKLFNRKAG